ncbi:MAG: hypothetical protein QW041_01270 [Candidatus Pacearchaeota archaeon]
MKNKKGFEFAEIGKWIIGLAVLVILILFINSLATGRLAAALQNILDIFRFGR